MPGTFCAFNILYNPLMKYFVERIYPIPKPKYLPEAIYASASLASSTLQEQMRFERDADTLSRLIVSSINLFLRPRTPLMLRRVSYGKQRRAIRTSCSRTSSRTQRS